MKSILTTALLFIYAFSHGQVSSSRRSYDTVEVLRLVAHAGDNSIRITVNNSSTPTYLELSVKAIEMYEVRQPLIDGGYRHIKYMTMSKKEIPINWHVFDSKPEGDKNDFVNSKSY